MFKTKGKIKGVKRTLPCHSGNTKLFQLLDVADSGWLMAGGWLRDAKITKHVDAVVDLAASVSAENQFSAVQALTPPAKMAFANTLATVSQSEISVLNLYIRDMSVPNWCSELWLALANDVHGLLATSRNVLICCNGGHGRTGLAVSILADLLRPDLTQHQPIRWLRSVYCATVVETQSQVDYVYDILALDDPRPAPSKPAIDEQYGQYQWSGCGSQPDHEIHYDNPLTFVNQSGKMNCFWCNKYYVALLPACPSCGGRNDLLSSFTSDDKSTIVDLVKERKW